MARNRPIESLKFAAWQLAEWRDFPAPWRREKIAWQLQVDELFVQMGELLTMRAHCDRPERDPLYQSLQAHRGLLGSLSHR